MNRWIGLVASAVICWAAATACSGGSGGGSSASPPAPVADVTSASGHYASAKVSLKGGDLDAAKAEYEKTMSGNASSGKSVGKVKTVKDLANGDFDEALSDYEKTVANTPNDVKANFGLGLIKLAQLGQGTVATAILDKFGQPPLKTSLVVGPDGFLAKLSEDKKNCITPSFKDFPFGNLPKLGKYKYRKLLVQAKPDLTSADVQKALIDIAPVLQDVISEWEVAAKDPNFSFILPKELFYSNADIVIKHADLSIGIAGLYASLAGIDFANSWTADIGLGKLVDATGKAMMEKADVLTALNKFFVLKADNKLADAKVNLTKALQQGQSALKEFQNGNVGGAILVNDAAKAGIQELLTMTNEVLASFDASTAISTTAPLAHLNLGFLFASPPDAGKIDIDPFVLEGSHIKPVESFFQKFVDGVMDVSLKQKSFKIFTNAVKGKSFRKSIFVNFISLFKDIKGPGCLPPAPPPVSVDPAPTITSFPDSLIVSIGETKIISDVQVKSGVGIQSVTMGCDSNDVKLKLTVMSPAFDPVINANAYSFSLQINAVGSGNCWLEATDTKGQKTKQVMAVTAQQ